MRRRYQRLLRARQNTCKNILHAAKLMTSKGLTLIPAVLHLPTAPGTASRGGSIKAIRPRKTSPSFDLGWIGSCRKHKPAKQEDNKGETILLGWSQLPVLSVRAALNLEFGLYGVVQEVRNEDEQKKVKKKTYPDNYTKLLNTSSGLKLRQYIEI